VGHCWHVTLTKNGLEWAAEDHPADTAIKAPVKELLLIMNRRREPRAIEGDRALWQRWWEKAKF
jgi:hypothetical protein